jgi:hypothetical protein
MEKLFFSLPGQMLKKIFGKQELLKILFFYCFREEARKNFLFTPPEEKNKMIFLLREALNFFIFVLDSWKKFLFCVRRKQYAVKKIVFI